MKATRSGNTVDELGVLYRTQAVRLRRILRAKFVNSAEVAGNGDVPKAALSIQDVDDLIQDVFARLLASGDRARLDHVREPTPYLVAAARNLVVDSIRRRRRRTRVESSFQSPELAHLQLGTFEDAELYERRLEAVTQYVACLPPELSAAFDARFARGLSQRDAAMALGVTRRRVRTLEDRLVAEAGRSLRFRRRAARCPR